MQRQIDCICALTAWTLRICVWREVEENSINQGIRRRRGRGVVVDNGMRFSGWEVDVAPWDWDSVTHCVHLRSAIRLDACYYTASDKRHRWSYR